VPPLCFALECGLSGDASSADGNAAEDSVVNEAPRLPSITEGLIVSSVSYGSSHTEMVRHQLRCQRFSIGGQEHQSLILRDTGQGSLRDKVLLSCSIVNALATHVAMQSNTRVYLYSGDRFQFSGNHIKAVVLVCLRRQSIAEFAACERLTQIFLSCKTMVISVQGGPQTRVPHTPQSLKLLPTARRTQ
jgi:hypothetical protein